MNIEIRSVATYTEYMTCVKIQQVVWGEFEAVPQHMLFTAHKSGGVCLGAFDMDVPGEPLVGFVFGMLGRSEDGELKHASHMAAVLPGYRDARIGERLKWAQREQVLAQGIDLMTWTFDPLISRNAFLNIAKLGATCRTYYRNIYGPEPEDAYGELPSDRFRLDWRLSSAGVAARAAGSFTPPTPTELRALAPLANPSPIEPIVEPVGKRFLIQIPADIDALRALDMQKARAWRYQVRALCETAFAASFTITAFARDGEVGLYLLERG